MMMIADMFLVLALYYMLQLEGLLHNPPSEVYYVSLSLNSFPSYQESFGAEEIKIAGNRP